MSRLPFSLDRTSSHSKARAGRFRTLHGEVQTPVFMPVGTQATVKGQTVESLRAAGSRVLLANTYHLSLRPGPEVFRRFGGIHRFMNWDGPVLTDSGGFQIFSLSQDRAMNEEGAWFKSYVDGTPHLLSPETSIAMQRAIGSDIMMVLDQCISSTAAREESARAMELTHRWARRSLEARGDSPQALFGIVQGACHPDLRRISAEVLSAMPFDGLAIGGLAVGETQAERYRFTGLVTDFLPAHLPRYLMGVGTPLDILEAVHRGVDMFDCIIPSQLAQRGTAFTSHGKIHCRRSVYKFSEERLDAACDCVACRDYSRAYLHHLVKSDETLGSYLLTVHNLTFYHRLMSEMRASILRDEFAQFYAEQCPRLGRTDDDHPSVHPAPAKVRHPPRRGDYEVVRGPTGHFSIRQISSGEVMHSVSNPSDEANALYVEQSRLAERLREAGPVGPVAASARPPTTRELPVKRPIAGAWPPMAAEAALVVWDVGLGAASNAMAAIACFERVHAAHGSEALRPLHLVSFERDLDPLILATKKSAYFPHLQHAAPHALQAEGHWTHASGLLRWDLLTGDFLERFAEAPAADLIFYDPFSAKTDTGLWTAPVFARLRNHGREKPFQLYTYSSATAVRVAMLSAGFFVAEGAPTGPKRSTTVGFSSVPPADWTSHLLGLSWLARWRRSHSQYPAELADRLKPDFARHIESHPQFGSSLAVDPERRAPALDSTKARL